MDLRRPDLDFAAACLQRYQPDMKSTRLPTNLLRMRTFKDGDLLVTPHLSEFGKVTITVVDGDYPGCYNYVQNDGHDQNHRIRVKGVYGLNGNISIGHVLLTGWYAKLQALRLPVLPISDNQEAFEAIIRELVADPNKQFDTSPLTAVFDDWLAKALEAMKCEIRKNANGVYFEKVCARLLAHAGYENVRRNFHKSGGDVDLQCSRNRTILSPFEAGQVNLVRPCLELDPKTAIR